MADSSKRWASTNAAAPESLAITLVRVMVGAVFILHGWQKWTHIDGTLGFFDKLGLSHPAAYAAMSAELGCGILLVLGLLTRVAAIPIIATMAVAIVKVHLANGFFGDPTTPFHVGYEFPLTLAVCALALFLAGSGSLALDNVLFGRSS